MPEISDAEQRQFVRYQMLGTPEEVEKKINDLERDNRQYRQEKIPELEKKIPGEGAVVLTGDEAKAYPALKELTSFGTAAEIKAKLDQGETNSAELADLKRKESVRLAATAAGYKDSVLLKLPGAEKLKFETKQETVNEDGKTKQVDVAYVTGSGEGATPQKLTEYAEKEWSDFLPSLKLSDEERKESKRPSFPETRENGDRSTDTKGGIDDQIQKNSERASAGNALRPAKTT